MKQGRKGVDLARMNRILLCSTSLEKQHSLLSAAFHQVNETTFDLRSGLLILLQSHVLGKVNERRICRGNFDSKLDKRSFSFLETSITRLKAWTEIVFGIENPNESCLETFRDTLSLGHQRKVASGESESKQAGRFSESKLKVKGGFEEDFSGLFALLMYHRSK